MGETLSIARLLVSVAESASAIKALTLWQKLTLAFYTLAAGASTYGVSHDWKYAVAAALGACVTHVHGQLQPSPSQTLPIPDPKMVASQVAAAAVHEADKVAAGEGSKLLTSTKF